MYEHCDCARTRDARGAPPPHGTSQVALAALFARRIPPRCQLPVNVPSQNRRTLPKEPYGGPDTRTMVCPPRRPPSGRASPPKEAPCCCAASAGVHGRLRARRLCRERCHSCDALSSSAGSECEEQCVVWRQRASKRCALEVLTLPLSPSSSLFARLGCAAWRLPLQHHDRAARRLYSAAAAGARDT